MWLPSAVSAQSLGADNWISQSLDPLSDVGLPHSEVLQQFFDTSAAVADMLAGVQTDQAQGLAALAIQAAHNRINQEFGKKIDELAASTSQASTPRALSTMYLPDGSILNPAKNTFTLPDGTVLNITTGLKVIGAIVNVTA